jgi:glucosamine kinase
VNKVVKYLLGIDGGGTGTRVRVAPVPAAGVAPDSHAMQHARGAIGVAGPSALSRGACAAWDAIGAAAAQAFDAAGLTLDWAECVLGCGLSGVNHSGWRAEFLAAAPGTAALVLESDAVTTALGAHAGAPGVVVALGTGSVGLVVEADGACRSTGGCGFPSGDEAGGAWFGLRAIAHAQQALDGRAPRDAYAADLLAATGASDRDSLVVWCAAADQHAYARLAPVVLAHARHPAAQALIATAAREVVKMTLALDPQGRLPLALCGGLARPLLPHLLSAAPGLGTRLREPAGDAACGALLLAARHTAGKPPVTWTAS